MKRPAQWFFEKLDYDPYKDINNQTDIHQVRAVRGMAKLFVGSFGAMGAMLAVNIASNHDAIRINAEPPVIEEAFKPLETGINLVLMAPQLGAFVLAGSAAYEGTVLHRAANARLRQLGEIS